MGFWKIRGCGLSPIFNIGCLRSYGKDNQFQAGPGFQARTLELIHFAAKRQFEFRPAFLRPAFMREEKVALLPVVRKNGKPKRGRADFTCWERRRPGGTTFMKTNALVSERTVPARRQRS